MKQVWLLFVCSFLISIAFFWQTLFKGLLPIPADALVGLYHPYRDYFASTNPQGVAYKNFILTDPVLQQYPWKWLVINGWKETISDAFKSPTLPWQSRTLLHVQDNPYNFSGTPLLANIQSGTFYPLNVLFLLINNFSIAWTIFIIIQPLLAMIFMALWLREHKIGFLAQLFGGLIWAFSSFNLVWIEWGNIGHAGLWLPFVLLAVDKLQKAKIKKQKVMKWHVLLQFSLMSSLFAGHFQVTFYLLVAVALYWFIRLGISKRSISLFTIHCLLFTVLTSIQWIPSLKLTIASNRNVEQENVLQREGFFIKPKQLVQIITPDFFGNPATLNYRGAWNYSEQVIYVGILPLLLILFVLFRTQKVKSFSNTKRFAVLLLVGCLLFAVDNPIARLPYALKIPFIRSLQPTRLSYLIVFSLSTLAAFGMERLRRLTQKDWKAVAVSAGILVGFFAILVVISSKFTEANRLVSQRNLAFPAFLFIVSLVGLLVAGFTQRRHSRMLLLTAYCLLLTAFDLFRFGWKFIPFSPVSYLYPITPSLSFLQRHMGPEERFMTLDRRILPPNANVMYRLKSINGYDPIYSKNYALKITEMESGKVEYSPANFGRIVVPANYRSPIAKTLNVRYVLSLAEIDDSRLEKVFQEGETRIYEIKGE